MDLRIRTPGPEQTVLSLSGGNQQKVVLAKWLRGPGRNPDLRRADPRHRRGRAGRDIYLLMNRLGGRGRGRRSSISSDLPEVLGMSDRILVMRAGAVQREVSAADATDARVLERGPGARVVNMPARR